MVRAKFQVTNISVSMESIWNADTKWSDPMEVVSIDLFPVYGNSDENKKFFAATPAGTIQLRIVNTRAASNFEIGKEYYVDFTLAEK